MKITLLYECESLYQGKRTINISSKLGPAKLPCYKSFVISELLIKKIPLNSFNLSVLPICISRRSKSKKPGFFVVPFTLPEKPITFGVSGTISACAKKPEAHTCVW